MPSRNNREPTTDFFTAKQAQVSGADATAKYANHTKETSPRAETRGRRSSRPLAAYPFFSLAKPQRPPRRHRANNHQRTTRNQSPNRLPPTPYRPPTTDNCPVPQSQIINQESRGARSPPPAFRQAPLITHCGELAGSLPNHSRPPPFCACSARTFRLSYWCCESVVLRVGDRQSQSLAWHARSTRDCRKRRGAKHA